MNLTFRNVREDERGILCDLLERTYRPLKDLNEHPWIPADDLWQSYDDQVFDNLSEELIMLTELDRSVVGFASYNLIHRGAVIGRNTVLPEHGGKGIGTAQVREIIRRCRDAGAEVIHVLTGDHPFFERAQRMYLKCGFNEVDRSDDGNGIGRTLIRYRLDLTEEGD